ncbi:hypothetical protein OUZ56_002853 [Daphnia magna]|uniref:Uncharacterized protein n=1 Tax=Daphnia magna TaxID=35525 RepID=A0ABR0A716_9CRUS|nr:hypothetical protein OUZ56_002853 [Daphnia magna]
MYDCAILIDCNPLKKKNEIPIDRTGQKLIAFQSKWNERIIKRTKTKKWFTWLAVGFIHNFFETTSPSFLCEQITTFIVVDVVHYRPGFMPVIPIYGEDITTTSGSTRSVRDEASLSVLFK